jgi:hypothetical protein
MLASSCIVTFGAWGESKDHVAAIGSLAGRVADVEKVVPRNLSRTDAEESSAWKHSA